MPIHDWTKVSAGTFHSLHTSWIVHLKEMLNGGLLPEGYYALEEQHASKRIADILALHAGNGLAGFPRPTENGGLALAKAPPKVSRHRTLDPEKSYFLLRRTLTLRHVSGHRVIALVEILSPSNKDRAENVASFAAKVVDALEQGVHVLVVDLFPPTRFDPQGIHDVIWNQLGGGEEPWPVDQPLAAVSYRADRLAEAFVEPLAVGQTLPDMPLFYDIHQYVPCPLENAYMAAFRGFPTFMQKEISG